MVTKKRPLWLWLALVYGLGHSQNDPRLVQLKPSSGLLASYHPWQRFTLALPSHWCRINVAFGWLQTVPP